MFSKNLGKIALVSLVLLLIYYVDVKSSMYGNGIFRTNYSLGNGLYLLKINERYVTFDKNWKFEDYIINNDNYVTKNNDTLQIKKVLGFLKTEKETLIKVSTLNEKCLYLAYKSRKEVYSFNPTLVDCRKSISDTFHEIVDFNKIPFFVYYWKVIFLVIILTQILIIFKY